MNYHKSLLDISICNAQTLGSTTLILAGPSGCAVFIVGLRSLSSRDCEFESHRGHGCLSVVIVVCCHLEVSAKS